AAATTTPIVGVVRDQETKKPLPGVTIQGRIASALGLRQADHELRAVTDNDGRYRLLGLGRTEGREILALPAAGQPYLASAKTAGAAAGVAPVTLDFNLKCGVVVRGSVTDKATGKPLAGIHVEYFAFVDNPSLKDAPGFRGSGLAEIRSDQDGSFTIVGM